MSSNGTIGGQPTHLWHPNMGKEDRGTSGYALCGVSIGRFVSDPERVTCPNCLAILANNPGE